jgi:hypothetical protein
MELIPSINWPSRNTKAMQLRIGGVYLFYSYDTLIGALLTGRNPKMLRVKNTWGPTTGKHIKIDHEIESYDIVSAQELHEAVNHYLAQYFQSQLREKFL